MKRTHLSLAIGLTLSLAAMQAVAQTAPAAADEARSDVTTLDAVEVTARRRTESLQDVPVAVSAFSETALKDLQASNIDGLQGAVPNLNIVPGRGSSNSVNVFIRGVGQPDALQTFDPGVGMYVDDVYYSRINGALFSLFDVGQVEVLRGPQGTLYGRNSTGGAIKLTTKDPFDGDRGAVELTAGNFGRAEGRAYASFQLSETMAASIAGAWINSDGYVTDPTTGKDYNGEDTRAIRAKLAFRPSDAFNATLALDYTRQDNALTLGEPTAPLTQTDFSLGTVVLRPYVPGEYNFQTRTSFDPDQGQELTHAGVSLAMNWNLNDRFLFKSITAYRELETESYIDIDASEFELGDVLVAIDQDQFSQEFQLQYDNGGNFKAVMGLFYLDENVPSHQEAYADDFLAFGGVPLTFLRTIDDDLSNTSYAGFVHASWEFAPTWTLSTGLRYSKDKKNYFRTTSTFSNLALLAADPQNEFTIEDSWSAWTPSFSLQKQVSENAMAYVSGNRGYKAGGFNGRANTAPEISSFDPEFVTTWEVGMKLQSEDRRMRGNFALFSSDYTDFQARVSEIQNPGAPIPTFAFPVLNAAELSIRGAEFEGSALLGEATVVSAQVGFQDARYDKFVDPRTATNPALFANIHDHVPFSPKVTARLAVQHTFDLAGGSRLAVGADASYRDETWLSVDNRVNLRQGEYTLYGLFGAWTSAEGQWEVRAGVRNLSDEVYKTEGQEFSSVGNIQTAYYGMPRNYYASLRYNF
ncbi:MAG TPA: TonB-dependent receptor [Arenimonas sp.]|uniref:TonB-dependent receptor n=1 Tax=Arenimonas sp. TaxID=1872635 RepID=UPI002D7F739C|nr:TonB-dependent receptor [Arenimonas sp.]HEU0153664.1 TonB-dependent receptor [Arenimonas sp.]